MTVGGEDLFTACLQTSLRFSVIASVVPTSARVIGFKGVTFGSLVSMPSSTGMPSRFAGKAILPPGDAVEGAAGLNDEVLRRQYLIAAEHGLHGSECGVFVVAETDQDRVLAVHERVVFDTRPLDLKVAVRGGIRDAQHETQRGAGVVAGESFEVIAAHDVILADDADAARPLGSVAEKHIPFDDAPIAVTQRERAADFKKRILAVDVAARLVGDALGLAVALLEEVFFDHAAAHEQ